MPCVEDICSNEELAVRVQKGDVQAVEQLLEQNKGYIHQLAMSLCSQYDMPGELHDLEQEGSLALLAAAETYDPERNIIFLSYASAAIQNRMLDYLARNASAVSIPPSRYHALRRVSYLCAAAPVGTSREQLIEWISTEMGVSVRVAATLLEQHFAFLVCVPFDDRVLAVSYGGDPAVSYETKLKMQAALQALESLKPRERNIVKYHIGLALPGGRGMTFEELTIKLNYNGPSGAEKAYKSAIKKLRNIIYDGEYGAWLKAKRAIHMAAKQLDRHDDTPP